MQNMQNRQDSTVVGALSRAVMAAALSVTVMAAGLVAVASSKVIVLINFTLSD